MWGRRILGIFIPFSVPEHMSIAVGAQLPDPRRVHFVSSGEHAITDAVSFSYPSYASVARAVERGGDIVLHGTLMRHGSPEGAQRITVALSREEPDEDSDGLPVWHIRCDEYIQEAQGFDVRADGSDFWERARDAEGRTTGAWMEAYGPLARVVWE